jgi:hypothetical protein
MACKGLYPQCLLKYGIGIPEFVKSLLAPLPYKQLTFLRQGCFLPSAQDAVDLSHGLVGIGLYQFLHGLYFGRIDTGTASDDGQTG